MGKGSWEKPLAEMLVKESPGVSCMWESFKGCGWRLSASALHLLSITDQTKMECTAHAQWKQPWRVVSGQWDSLYAVSLIFLSWSISHSFEASTTFLFDISLNCGVLLNFLLLEENVPNLKLEILLEITCVLASWDIKMCMGLGGICNTLRIFKNNFMLVMGINPCTYLKSLYTNDDSIFKTLGQLVTMRYAYRCCVLDFKILAKHFKLFAGNILSRVTSSTDMPFFF